MTRRREPTHSSGHKEEETDLQISGIMGGDYVEGKQLNGGRDRVEKGHRIRRQWQPRHVTLLRQPSIHNQSVIRNGRRFVSGCRPSTFWVTRKTVTAINPDST